MTQLSLCFRAGPRLALIVVLASSVSGCISIKMKEQQIRGLETELEGIKTASDYLAEQPKLGAGYDGRLFVSEDALNRLLAGLDGYQIPLEAPRGAKIYFDQSRFDFKDGMPSIVVAARAVDRSGSIEIKLKVRADLRLSADTAQSNMNIRLVLREVTPDFRFSIFRLRESWFAAFLLMREGQAHLNSLPDIAVPLEADLPIILDPPRTTRLEIEHGWIDNRLGAPKLSLRYQYRVIRILPLQDGVHMFFALSRVQ